MNSKKVSISIGALQRKYGPREALRIAKEFDVKISRTNIHIKLTGEDS